MTGVKLNGWQRVWVLASVLVGIAFMYHGVGNIPTAEREASAFYDRPALDFSVRFKDGASIDTGTDAAQKYVNDKEDLIYRQLGYVAILAGEWVAACLALYALGWLVGWTVRGFLPLRPD